MKKDLKLQLEMDNWHINRSIEGRREEMQKTGAILRMLKVC